MRCPIRDDGGGVEVFIGGQWTTVGPLPTAVAALAGVTIDNTVYMTGLYAEPA